MTLIADAIKYLDEFTKKVEQTGIDVSNLNLDHVAYQASSTKDYENKKPEFEEIANYTHEAIVNGRKVGVFGLEKPIDYKGNTIVALELIEPTKGQVCESAWEHAEYVLNETYRDFIAKYPDLDWITSSIERNVYSHLKLRLDEDTQLKFHMHDILETIRLEEMHFRPLTKNDIPLLTSLEKKAFPPDPTEDDSVHSANSNSQLQWIDPRRNLSYIYQDKEGNITGVIALVPLSRKGWEFVKDKNEADVDEYGLVGDKLFDPGDSEVGLYIYMIEKLDMTIQNFTQKAYKHVFSEAKERFGFGIEQIICVAGYSVSPVAINIAFNKLSRMEVKPLNMFMAYTSTGELVHKAVKDITEFNKLLSDGYNFRNRCRLTAVTPADPSPIWEWFQEA